MRRQSTVLTFDRARGWGWALPNDGCNDVFIHRSHLQTDRKNLNEGDVISFKMGPHDGKPCATRIRYLYTIKSKAAVQP